MQYKEQIKQMRESLKDLEEKENTDNVRQRSNHRSPGSLSKRSRSANKKGNLSQSKSLRGQGENRSQDEDSNSVGFYSQPVFNNQGAFMTKQHTNNSFVSQE